jgi:peroxiredoxin
MGIKEALIECSQPKKGKESIIAGKAKKNIKVIINPPSIPTRFQTMHYDDAEEKAFASTEKRFRGVSNDLPGFAELINRARLLRPSGRKVGKNIRKRISFP